MLEEVEMPVTQVPLFVGLAPWVRLALTWFGAALLFSGCGGSNRSETSRLKIFDYVNIDLPKDFDPAFSKTTYDGIGGALVLAGLVQFGKGAEVEPALAERWEVSPDGLTYTFHLRPAQFSDGRPISAADVIYSFSRLLRPEVNSDRKWVVDRIAGAEQVLSGQVRDLPGMTAPTSTTVVIQLDRPHPPFLTKLAMPAGGIIPDGSADLTDAEGQPAVDREFTRRPIGSGPFVLTNWRRDQRIEFERNPNYWGPKPFLDRFIYHMQDNDSVQRQMLQQGKIDIYPIVGFGVFNQWRQDPAMAQSMIPVPELNTYYLGIMCSKPYLQDRRIRQAISHAIDTRTIFEQIHMERGTLAHGPVPVGIPGYQAGRQPRAHDPARTKALLEEANATTLTLRLWYRTEAQNDEIAAALAANLRDAGIPTELVKRDYASINEAIFQGEPDLFLWSWWLDYPDIENALVPPFHSRNIPRMGNRAHFNVPEVDTLLDEALAENDPQRRLELFQLAEDRIVEETPWIPLYHRKTFAVIQPWVQGFEPALMFNANRYTSVDLVEPGIGR
jgi:ABC-type transport system substrate-binding protein